MPKNLIAAVSFLVLAATNLSPAWAGWGCKAANGGAHFGRAWAAATKKEARAGALQNCAAGGYKGCKIVICADHVDNQQQADIVLPLTPTQEVKRCIGRPCQKGKQ